MRKSVLFVDDNPLLLQMYAAALESEGDRWDVLTTKDGREALSLLGARPFDIVVSDLHMPGIDGIQLMSEVHRQYPQTSRIILSGVQDQEQIARSLNSTHQFLSKPVKGSVLKATLERVGGLDAYLKEPKLQALLGQMQTLPSFPSIYGQIMKELDTEEPSLEKISALITSDPGMTGKMLQIVNSAALGLAHRVTSPVEAVQFLGMGAVRSLALSAHIFTCFQQTQLTGFSAAALAEHGMKTALVAQLIMRLEGADLSDGEEAFIAAMLHDLGKLILADNLPQKFSRFLQLENEKGVPGLEAELEVFGATHSGVAAYLLGLWGLPVAMIEAVAFHHAPSTSGSIAFGPLTAVHVADYLEHELSGDAASMVPKLDREYLARLHLAPRLEAWRTAAAEMLGASTGSASRI